MQADEWAPTVGTDHAGKSPGKNGLNILQNYGSREKENGSRRECPPPAKAGASSLRFLRLLL